MKSKQNKLPISIELTYNNQEQCKQCQFQNIIAQKILYERQQKIMREEELKKIQVELLNRINHPKMEINQPIRYAQYVIRQRQDGKKQSNQSVHQAKFQETLKIDTSIYQDVENKNITRTPEKINQKRKLSMKYRDIVKSILVKSITNSFHDDSLNIRGLQQKPKSISQHEQISELKPIDKYILLKLENIASEEVLETTLLPTHLYEMATSNSKKSFQKLIPITTASQENNKFQKLTNSDKLNNTRLIQEFQVDPRNRNYEITRKAQERMILYQKFLRNQNPNRSTSCVRQQFVKN